MASLNRNIYQDNIATVLNSTTMINEVARTLPIHRFCTEYICQKKAIRDGSIALGPMERSKHRDRLEGEGVRRVWRVPISADVICGQPLTSHNIPLYTPHDLPHGGNDLPIASQDLPLTPKQHLEPLERLTDLT